MHCVAAKKVSAFPEKLVCKDRPMSYKNAQYTRYYLHLFSLSKPQFLTARSLGKARARYLFQWMLFEKGQNFKSRRPFRPDLCPVLLVNHWRKILVCISPFFQSFSITGHLAPVMPSAKIAPIGEREREAFYFCLMLPLLLGNTQVLKMQHLKTYKIHKMPLAKRHAQRPARDRIFVQNIVALAASLHRFTCGSMSEFFANKTLKRQELGKYYLA